MKHKSQYIQRGFTLIELLIVVAIIAIISAIAVPKMLKAVNLSKDKKVMTSMRNIAVAIGIYTIEFEIVPQATDITEVMDALQAVPGNDQVALNTRDAWGYKFYYTNVSQNQYTLKSFGKDGGESTSASTEYFDPAADTIIITGVFKASHQGATAVVGN